MATVKLITQQAPRRRAHAGNILKMRNLGGFEHRFRSLVDQAPNSALEVVDAE